jgi:hypothetical protein
LDFGDDSPAFPGPETIQRAVHGAVMACHEFLHGESSRQT